MSCSALTVKLHVQCAAHAAHCTCSCLVLALLCRPSPGQSQAKSCAAMCIPCLVWTRPLQTGACSQSALSQDLSAAGFCKQQLWPLFHYLLPLSPGSSGRFDPDLWQAYVKANKVGCGSVAALIAVHDRRWRHVPDFATQAVHTSAVVA